MIGLGLSIPEVAVRGGIVAPSFVPRLANGAAAGIYADFTTEGGTNQYWAASAQRAGFAAWLAALGGTFTRASSANYFQSGLLVTAGSGALRLPTTSGGTPTGIRITPAQTELLLSNRDLTNAAWVATTVTVAKDQTGIDGTAAAASSLTATGANGTVLQTLTRGSAARLSGCWVKRITGSGAIQMTQDNGTTWTAITVTASYSQIATVIPVATLANPVVGFRIVTNGDAIAVDFVAHREMATGTNGIPDPIATTGATVTQAGDRILFPYTATTGAVLTYTQNLIATGASPTAFGGDSAASAIFVGLFDATHFETYNGSVQLAPTGTSTIANLNKVMSSGTTGARKIIANNSGLHSDANNYAGASYTNGVVGGFATGVANNMAGDLARLGLWPGLVASDADVGTLTT